MLKLVRIGNHKKAQQGQVVFTLLPDRKYVVGRKGADISFEDDTSVSRAHAHIEIEHPLGNVGTPSIKPTVCLTDLGSKFGSYVNDGIESKSKVAMQEPLTIAQGGRIRFGVQWNEYRIDYTPLVVTSSKLKDLASLKSNVRLLGGHLVSEWGEDTDYLVMEKIMLTLKVVGALIFGKHIVTPDYFEDYIKAVEEGVSHGGEYDLTQHLPDPGNYLPILSEKSLEGLDDSFRSSPTGRELFRGKYFVFPDQKSLKNYSGIVKGGGGECNVLTAAEAEGVFQRKSSQVVIIGDEEHLLVKVYGREKLTLEGYLRGGKRIVAEKEIGLAAVHRNTSVYTNPNSKKPMRTLTEVFGSQSTDEETQRSIIPETQEDEDERHVFHTMTPLGRSVIQDSAPRFKRERQEESLEETQEVGTSKRRRKNQIHSDDDDDEKPEPLTSSQTMTQNSHSVREKKLASLFCMSDSDDDEDVKESVNVVPHTLADTHLEETIPATADSSFTNSIPTSQKAGTSGTTQRRTSQRSVSRFEISVPQDSEPLTASGIVPASPDFSDTPYQPSSTSVKTDLKEQVSVERVTRSRKRKDDEQETAALGEKMEETLKEENQSVNKRRKVLHDTNNSSLESQHSANVERTNGFGSVSRRNGTGRIPDDDYNKVKPLEYSFSSLILNDSSNLRNRSTTFRNESDDGSSGVNFKRFRKVMPVFVHDTEETFTFISQATCEMSVDRESFGDEIVPPRHVNVEDEDDQVRQKKGNERTRGRRREAVPQQQVVNTARRDSIEDDFSF